MKELFIAIILDFFSFLKKEKNFLHLDTMARKNALERTGIFPESFISYFSSCTEEQYILDCRKVFQANKKLSDLHLNPQESSLFKAMADFIMDELPRFLDERSPVSFQGYFADALHTILQSSNYYEVSSLVQNYLQKYFSGTVSMVETSCEMEPSLKGEIRKLLRHRYPFSFPIFNLNKNLIGGIRIFADGLTYDFSWLSKIKKIFSTQPEGLRRK